MSYRTIAHAAVLSVFALGAAALVLLGLPVKTYGGFIFVSIFMALFITRPLYFLCFLFFIRALLDNYFVSIRFSMGGVDIGLGGAFSIFLILGTLLTIILHRQNTGRLTAGVVVWYFLFCAVSIGSAAISPDRTGSLKELVRRFSIFSILVVTLLSVESERDAARILKAIVFSAILPVLYGFVTFGRAPAGRLTGTFAHPNILAFYLLIIIGCVVFGLHREEDRRPWVMGAGGYFLFLLSALVLTLTRSAWAALLFMSGVYALFFKRKWILPVLVLTLCLGLVPPVQHRIQELFVVSGGSVKINEQSSLGWRLRVWERLWQPAMKKPLTGYGINAAAFASGIDRFNKETHNDYLRFFLESGVWGFLCYFGAYLYPFLHAARRHLGYPEGSTVRKAAIFLLCFLPGFFLMSASENLARYTTVHFYIMGLFGVYFGLYFLKDRAADGRG